MSDSPVVDISVSVSDLPMLLSGLKLLADARYRAAKKDAYLPEVSALFKRSGDDATALHDRLKSQFSL